MVVLAVFVSSCEGAGVPRAAVPQVTAPSVVSKDFPYKDYAALLPLEAYTLSPSQLDLIDRSRNALVAGCMKGFGFSYEAPEAQANGLVADRRYGLEDPKSAEAIGYHMPPPATLPAHKSPSVDEQNALFGTAASAVHGFPVKQKVNGKPVLPSGCIGYAFNQFARFSNAPAIVAAKKVGSQSFMESLQSPSLKADFVQWSACMRHAGYSYTSPLDPFSNPKFNEGSASGVEILTATADLSCKYRTGLMDKWFSIEAELQRSLIEQDAKDFQQVKPIHVQEVAYASMVLEGGTGGGTTAGGG